MRLILASGSKNRQNLFKMIGFKFEVIKSLDEEESKVIEPSEYVIELSKIKANSVEEQIDGDAIIISADGVMYLDDKIFEKPKTKEEAFNNMKSMSGKIVKAYTGVTIKDLYKNKEITFSDVTEIYFKEISEEDINWYIDNDKEILNCCGFSLEGKAALFIEKIVGDYNNARGIPLNKLCDKLKELGYSLEDFELE